MRKINELIWHYTATPAGREVTIDEVRAWHKARGWTDVGYHKLVHLDGSVSEGRPESIVGAHTRGHNTGTIGYCYVGGIRNDPNVGVDTRTDAQKATMRRLTAEAIKKYNLKRVSGHRDHGATQCPAFSPSIEYQDLFAAKGAAMTKRDPADNSLEKKSAVLVAAATATEMSDKVMPFAGISEYLTYVAIALGVTAAGLIGYSQWSKKH